MRHPDTLTRKGKTHTVTQIDSRNWTVISGLTGNEYTVTTLDNGASCSCDWAKYRPAENNGRCGCSHVLAVIAHIEADKARTVKAFTSWEPVTRSHRQVLDIGDGLLLTTRKI
jgi:predicted nucleic acid-binding Zn finger protein